MPPSKSEQLLTESVQAGSVQASSGLFLGSSGLRKILSETQQTQPHHSIVARSVREILSRTFPEQPSALRESVVGRTEGAKD
jgi:hypothetical protein